MQTHDEKKISRHLTTITCFFIDFIFIPSRPTQCVPGGDGGGEVDAVLDERERGGPGDVLPLRAGGAACGGGGGILKIDMVSQFGKVSVEGYGERERIKRKKHFDQGTAGDFSK